MCNVVNSSYECNVELKEAKQKNRSYDSIYTKLETRHY